MKATIYSLSIYISVAWKYICMVIKSIYQTKSIYEIAFFEFDENLVVFFFIIQINHIPQECGFFYYLTGLINQ